MNGEQIPAPYDAVDIKVAGDTVLVGGYESEPKDGARRQWALVRGNRLEPLPVPAGAHRPGLSVDGRIAYWVEHRRDSNTTQFSTWDTETNTALASRTVPETDGRSCWGSTPPETATGRTSPIDTHLTRWDVRTNTIHPTDLTYDTMQGTRGSSTGSSRGCTQRTRTAPRTAPGWSSPDPSRRTRRLTAATDQLRVRPVGPADSLAPNDVTTLSLSKAVPEATFSLYEGDGFEPWWESNESVLVTVHGDFHNYLVRCPSTGAACQRVADFGPWVVQTDPSLPPWAGADWAFAQTPVTP